MWWFVAVFIVALVVAYAMAPKPQNAKPIGLEDVTVPTAEEGREICVIFGERVIDGPNLVWYGDMRTMAIRRQKQTIGYDIYLGMHLVLSHGPIDRVMQITADEKLAWEGNWTGGDIVFFNAGLFGGQDKEGGIAGRFSLDQGGPTQTVNPYLQAKIGGLVPAFRGVAAIVCQQIYVGTTAYLKKMGFRAKRIHVRQSGGITQWYDAKSEVFTTPPSGELITVQGYTLQDFYHGDTVDRPWNPPSTLNPVPLKSLSTRAAALDDRYLLVAGDGTTCFWCLDGINLTALSGSDTLTSGGSTNFPRWFNGNVVMGGGIDIGSGRGRFSYSLNKGASWIRDGSAPQLAEVICTDSLIIGYGPYNINWLVCGAPGGAWSTGALFGTMTFSFGYDSDSDGTMVMVGASDGSAPKLQSTSNGIGIIDEVLPGSVATDNLVAGVAYGNGVWACVTKNASTSNMHVCYKNPGFGWVESTSFVRPSGSDFTTKNIFFADNKFIVTTTGGAGKAQWTSDFLTWHNITGTVNPPYWFIGGVVFDTRDPGIGDMNPAHIIRECLTDPDWGLGYNDSDIDDTAFQAAADTLYNEGMGISVLWNTQTEINDFINNIVKHIDGSVYIDKSTGKFVLKLARFDYNPATLLVLDTSNCQYVSDFTQPTFGKLNNSVTVQFWDSKTNKDSSVTVQDIALVQMQGKAIDTTIQYPGFTNASIATRVAQRDLRTLSTPIISVTLYCNRAAADLNIGSVFKWTWPDLDINQLIMRVTGIAYGDGKRNQVRVTCTQDVYSLPLAPIVTPQPPLWVDPVTPPVAVPTALRLPYEVPYLEAVQRNGQTTVDALVTSNSALGYAGMAAGRPSQNSTFAHMNVDSGGGYANQATLDFSPVATLTNPIGKMDTSFAISGVDSIDAAPIGSWFQIDNELMSFVSYSAPTLTVKRGLLDTVPAAHIAGQELFFWDNFSANDETQYVNGQSVNIKVTPVTSLGELALVDAPADTLAIVGRLARPYPPANFKINAAYFPTTATGIIDFTWVHRDRLLQTSGSYLGFTDGSIGPEAGTTYNLNVYNDSTNVLMYSHLAIAGNSDLGVSLSTSGTIRIELESIRDSLTSFQKHVHVMAYISQNYRVTEASERRITEAGDLRITE